MLEDETADIKERKRAYDKAYREKHKECIKARGKAYYEENKERIRARQVIHYENNKERIMAYHRTWYEENREHIKALQTTHYEKNKERIKALHKAYREENRESIESYRKAYSEKNREHIRARNIESHRIRKYGLTSEEWGALFISQGSCCAICRSDDPNNKRGAWSTDHDHETGETRGILCLTCNSGLGQLGDNIESLEAAIRYLKRSKAAITG